MNIQRLNTGGNRWKQSRDNKIKTVKLKTDSTKTTKIKQEVKQGINITGAQGRQDKQKLK